MTKITPEQIIAALDAATVFVVDDSPYLHSYETESSLADAEHPSDIIFGFSWHDDEGQIFEVKFSEVVLSEAEVDENGTIFLPDADGEPTEIKLYDLKQIKPQELK